MTDPYSWGGVRYRKTSKKTTTQKDQSTAQEQNYKIGKIHFVVQPVFKEKNSDTIGTVLLRLMRSEMND